MVIVNVKQNKYKTYVVISLEEKNPMKFKILSWQKQLEKNIPEHIESYVS